MDKIEIGVMAYMIRDYPNDYNNFITNLSRNKKSTNKVISKI